jgi:hypothetical protein
MSEYAIIKGLLSLTEKLLSITGRFKKAKRDQQDRVAQYCEEISSTLSKAYKELEKGRIPHGCCSAMDNYMRNLRIVLAETLSKEEYEDLRDVLAVAYHVEYLDHEITEPLREGSKYAELEIAAGRFKAIAGKIRATT